MKTMLSWFRFLELLVTNQIRSLCFLLLYFLIFSPIGLEISPNQAFAEQNTNQVLILNSYHPGMRFSDEEVAGIRSTLAATTEVFIEYMDAKRNSQPDYLGLLAEVYAYKYAGKQFDLIFSLDDDALLFLLNHHDQIFPGIPVVFCGVNNLPEGILDDRSWITGVVEKIDIEETISIALTLFPERKNILVVTDNTTTGRSNRNILEKLARSDRYRVPFFFVDSQGDGLMLPELLEKLRSAKPDSLVYYSDFFQDSAGNALNLESVMPTVSQNSPGPIFVHGSIYLGFGALGGKLNSGFYQGQTAGQIAQQIWNGASPASIPVVRDNINRYMFDWNELIRWNVNLNRLPQGSIIHNRHISFYERYWAWIWSAVAFILFESAIIILLVLNVFRRRRAEKSLRESEALFRSQFEFGNIGIAITSVDQKWLKVNSCLCNMLGYDAEALLTKTWSEMTHPDDLQSDIFLFNKMLAGDIDNYELDKRFLKKDGTVVYTHLTVACYRNPDKSVNFVIASILDITERKISEETRELLEDQLRQAQKMEAIGRLAGGVAHDFNNMLMVILGRTDLALESLNPSHPIYQDLLDIKKSASNSVELTRQLLAFARKQTIDPKPLDLNKSIDGMLKMLQRLIGEDINLQWLPASDLWLVKLDPGQISQILANLAVNARDAIKGTGQLLIQTANVSFQENDCIDHPGSLPGDFVMLSVSDDGCGMDLKTQERLFEPFFTTKEMGKGTGLGLATVHGIVKQNHGFIQVQSQINQGSTFEIFFPRYIQSNSMTDTVETSKPILHRGTETVLLVEDESILLKLTTQMLESIGYQVLATSNPRTAIQYLGNQEKPVHLLLTDVVMPEINGRELAETARSLQPSIKCLFMSGYTADVIAHHGVLDQGVHYIQKPFNLDTLASKIRAFLDK